MELFPREGSGRSPPPPPPPPPPPQPRPQITQPQTTQPQIVPAGSVGIGIETEFLLRPRNATLKATTIREFSRMVASGYLQYIAHDKTTHPRMHNAIDESYLGTRFAEWSLDSDSTIEMPEKGKAPWGLENISPIFRAYPNSTWRSHVAIMWEYLESNYDVSANNSCGTHVHISLAEGFTLQTLKQVAQSIIHFEPAFEALLPENRRANEYSKSNWMDNPNFAYSKLSRGDSIALIEKCTTMRDLVLLMNPNHDKMFGWNFLYLLSNPKGTVEFRRGAASVRVQDVFMWVELAMSFIQASVRIGLPENFHKIPRTVGGLRWFIDNAGLPNQVHGMNDKRYLDLIFAGKRQDGTLSPKPLGNLSKEKAEKLSKKKEEDKAKNIMESKVMQAPYWG